MVFQGPPFSKLRWTKYVVLSLLCLFLLTLVVQMYRFGVACAYYAQVARIGMKTLPPDVSPNEAIVVLTGDRKRIPKALELLRLRGSPLLIISGAGKGITLTDLVNQQGDAAVRIHEVWDKIFVESRSSSTRENAQETAELAKKRHLTRIILVTSEYHMPRASAIFHQTMPWEDIIEYPVASDVSHIRLDLSGRTLNGLWYFWWEFLKNRLYRIYTSRYITPVEEK
jgi:uncharacterized SAM-binding protein YcdF (DUF218 family)